MEDPNFAEGWKGIPKRQEKSPTLEVGNDSAWIKPVMRDDRRATITLDKKDILPNF
jgi:hypothetical protein